MKYTPESKAERLEHNHEQLDNYIAYAESHRAFYRAGITFPKLTWSVDLREAQKTSNEFTDRLPMPGWFTIIQETSRY